MATTPFKYQAPFPLGPDTTEYYLLTKIMFRFPSSKEPRF